LPLVSGTHATTGMTVRAPAENEQRIR